MIPAKEIDGELWIKASDHYQAIKEALAQPAPVQEPVAWMHWLNGPCRVLMNKDEAMMELDRLNREYPADSHARKMRPLVFGDTIPPAQPAPVKIFQYNCLCGRTMKFESEHGVIAPQRTWVGLTDKELEEFSDAELGSYDLCLEVEARLKERNT